MQKFGPYILLRAIAEGGIGAAYLAVRSGEAPLRPVVVKRLREVFVSHRLLALRLRHEATIAVSVDCPNVVRVDGVGAVGGEPYVAMEYVRGWTLARLLQHLADNRRTLSMGASLSIVAGLLRGLDALHTARHPESGEPLGVVHRDLSPRNLILEPGTAATRPKAVIIDLGLGRSNARSWATRAGVTLGTPGYMAPEAMTGSAVDHRADLFCAALLGFEVLTLQHYVKLPKTKADAKRNILAAYRPISSIRAEVSEAVDAVFRRALSIDPGERFDSAKEMLEALEQASGSELADPDPADLPESYFEDARRVEAAVAKAIEPLEALPPSEAETTVIARRTLVAVEEPRTVFERVPLPPAEASSRPKGQVIGRAEKRAWAIGESALAAASLLVAALLLRAAFFVTAPDPLPTADLVKPAPARTVETPPTAMAAPSFEPPPLSKTRVDLGIKEPRPRRRAAPRAVMRSAGAAVPPTPLEERLERLGARASALKQKRPDLQPWTNRVLTDIALWRMSDEPEKVAAEAAALEAALGKMEAGAPSP